MATTDLAFERGGELRQPRQTYDMAHIDLKKLTHMEHRGIDRRVLSYRYDGDEIVFELGEVLNAVQQVQ